jgi:hypothetical protein
MSAGDSAGESSGRAVIPEELAALEDLVDSLKENDEDRMEE